MATEDATTHAPPSWFSAPGDTDYLAWITIALIVLALFGLVTLYAAFDRWAEHKSSGTPLAKTIPTLLTIALLYEIFPLDHFHVLLPLSAILIALMADWSRFHLVGTDGGGLKSDAPAPDPMDAEPLIVTGSTENV